MLVETERYEDCTVIINEDDVTGEIVVEWFRNDKPPQVIVTDWNEWSEEE